jgi:alkyl sulfatase BDS1-like metallo-beta-lactamase superfamily hydrolase
MIGLINSPHSDFTIRCLDGDYRVIKLILQASSDYFKLIDYLDEPVMMISLTRKQFLPVIEWIYARTNYVYAVDDFDIEDYAIVAAECRFMLLPRLFQRFISHLEYKLNPKSVVQIAKLAEEYQFENLAVKCHWFTRNNKIE